METLDELIIMAYITAIVNVTPYTYENYAFSKFTEEKDGKFLSRNALSMPKSQLMRLLNILNFCIVNSEELEEHIKPTEPEESKDKETKAEYSFAWHVARIDELEYEYCLERYKLFNYLKLHADHYIKEIEKKKQELEEFEDDKIIVTFSDYFEPKGSIKKTYK